MSLCQNPNPKSRRIPTAGWRRRLSFNVCDLPKGPVGQGGAGAVTFFEVPLRGITDLKQRGPRQPAQSEKPQSPNGGLAQTFVF